MKTISKHLLPRYVWFMLWFKQWFKNLEGIKGFATQILNELMQRTMKLAGRLKKKNRKLEQQINTLKKKLTKWYQHPTINADEWDEIKGKVRKLGFWIIVLIITEAACNYFAVESLMEGDGLFWLVLRMFVAIGITGGCLYLFEKWMAIVINKPAYKQDTAPKRNLIELVILTCICFCIEITFYWLCKRRAGVLEGNSGDRTVNNFLILFGMLLPVFVGYLAYERSRYVTPYHNTLRIDKAEKNVADKERTIATNNQYMEDHFKRWLEAIWTVFDEFRVYKENYNIKKGIKTEDLTGHFCANHDAFELEAKQRYNKDVLNLSPAQPKLIFTNKARNSSHNHVLVVNQ